jgi:hypothetical protein
VGFDGHVRLFHAEMMAEDDVTAATGWKYQSTSVTEGLPVGYKQAAFAGSERVAAGRLSGWEGFFERSQKNLRSKVDSGDGDRDEAKRQTSVTESASNEHRNKV